MGDAITRISILPPVQVSAGKRFYVASKFAQYRRARQLMDDLTAVGHTITHDWTRTKQFGPDGNPMFKVEDEPKVVPVDERREHATSDHRGVRTADYLVALMDQPSCGCPVEVGLAIAYGVQVLIVSPWAYTVFWDLPKVCVVESEELARVTLGIR